MQIDKSPYKMNEMNKLDDKKKRKRWISTIICIFYNFLFGLEYTSINISLLYYLQDFFNPQLANTRYSLIMAITFIPGFFSGVIGKINDKTKNLKVMMAVLLVVTGLGNLMYTLYYSIWFLFIGRFMGGMSTGLRSIIAGEFVRWWNDDQEMLQKVLFYYQMAFTMGFVIGPGLPILYADVNFTIGSWRITADNFMGLSLSILIGLCLVATIVGVSNNFQEEIRTNYEEQTLSLKDVILDYDIMLIFIVNGVNFFIVCAIDLVIPLVAVNNLNMTIDQLGISIFVSVTLFVIFMMTKGEDLFTGRPIAGFTICSFSNAYSLLFLWLAYFNLVPNIYFKEFILTTISLFNVMAGTSSEIVARELLSQIVPSHSTSYVEGLRNGVRLSFFALMGFLLASSIYNTILYSLPLILIISCLLPIPLYRRCDAIFERIKHGK